MEVTAGPLSGAPVDADRDEPTLSGITKVHRTGLSHGSPHKTCKRVALCRMTCNLAVVGERTQSTNQVLWDGGSLAGASTCSCSCGRDATQTCSNWSWQVQMP